MLQQHAQEPSGLLIFAVLFGMILACLALMGLVATIRQHGIVGIVQRITTLASATARLAAPSDAPPEKRQRRARRIPIWGANGRLAGSKRVPESGTMGDNRSNDAEPRSSGGTASERRGTTVPTVPQNDETVLTVPEMLTITAKLTQGIAPSDIAKSLPGYRGEKYKIYMEKVTRTQATLSEVGVHAAPAAETGTAKTA